MQDNPTVEKIASHLPSPAKLRVAALALAGVAAASLGRDLHLDAIIDAVTNAYTVLVPLVLATWFGHKSRA